MLDKFYLSLFCFFRFLVKSMPTIAADKMSVALATLVWKVDKKHRKIIRANLDLAFKNSLDNEAKTNIEKSCYKNMVFMIIDFIKNQGITKEEIAKKVIFENKHFLEELKGKPVIFITAHYGNWELSSLATAALLLNNNNEHIPLSIVGRPIEAKSIDKILRLNREQFNISMIEKNGAMKGLLKALKNNEAVGILVDQNTSDADGILIDFFGKPARHTPAASILSRHFNVPILPIFVTTNDWHNFKLTFYEPIHPIKTQNSQDDILALTQAQADITEKVIREKPDEWFWFHKRWKNQFEGIY